MKKQKEIEFEKDEHIVHEVRRHWLVFSIEVAILSFLAIVPLPIIMFILSPNNNFNLNFIEGNVMSLLFFAYALWLLILWLLGVVFWTNFFLDLWIVTSKRIVDVEQHGLFKRQVSFLRLDRIQDVSCKVKGLLPTMLNYGDISVHSAGIQGEFIIRGIPDPNFLNTKINEAIILSKEKNNKSGQVISNHNLPDNNNIQDNESNDGDDGVSSTML